MGTVTDLLERPVYTFAQVDELLRLSTTTAERWIDGYSRHGKKYEPIIRHRSTGHDLVTWGEFIECRFLSEYRDAGVSVSHMRPVVESLRQALGVKYPLASSALWLQPEGREAVARVQQQLGDELEPSMWVVRTNDHLLPIDWTPEGHRFQDSLGWSSPQSSREQVPVLIWADGSNRLVEINPLRSFGDPVVRGVKTSVLAELARAGDPAEMIADLYELDLDQVEAAIAYEERQAA